MGLLGRETGFRAALLIAATGLVWIGLAFLAYAAFEAVRYTIGPVYAALLTAAIFLLVAAAIVAFALRRPVLASVLPAATAPAPAPPRTASAAAAGNGAAPRAAAAFEHHDPVVAALNELALRQPFIAMGCAALLGVAHSIDQRRDPNR